MSTRSCSNKKRPSLAHVFLAVIPLMVIGCAHTEKHAENSAAIVSAKPSEIDPYEDINRSIYRFNNGLDQYVLKPVADGYKFIAPDFVEIGVSNFFNNLKGINVVLNDILQGKFRQGAADTSRFLTNTTLGIGGLIDVASEFGLQQNVEDFGQTLAVWGVDEGPYLVLPILGPTTIRDGGGSILDRAANPGTYVPFTSILEGINDRANAEKSLSFIEEAALDQYVFIREAYLQHRRYLINDGQSDNNRLDLDIETALTLEATPDFEAEETQDIDDERQLSIAVSDSLTAQSSTFDDMLLSFDQAWIKVDQLSNQTIP
ncbi:MlaA family lipoprotein [Methylomarinum vadi]|uniref:MlaA family lipoprotein n=1 Tax=Methylomarinum vadi TaxID=438855 RepID=UPI0006920D7C|nr:VacJ family lipoprotein [Methylomarinum vadi]